MAHYLLAASRKAWRIQICIIAIAVYQTCPVIDEANGQKPKRRTENQVSVAPTPAPSAQPIVEPPKTGEAGQRADNKQPIIITESRSSILEWAAIVLNFLLLLVVGYQARTYNQQLGSMKSHAVIMEGSLNETRKIVEQNERAVKASETQAIASQTSAEAAKRMVEVSQQAYVESSRAYVGIREIKMGGFLVGQIPTLYVIWYNGGNTPASRFQAIPYLVFGDEPETKGYFINDDWSDSRGNFLPTGEPQPMSYPQAETGFKPVTHDMLAELDGGGKRLYAMILARYLDFTGKARLFETSYVYDQWEEKFVELGEYGQETNPN